MISVLAAPSARSHLSKAAVLGLAVLHRLHLLWTVGFFLWRLVSPFPGLERLNLFCPGVLSAVLGPEYNARSAPVCVLRERQRSVFNGDTVRRLQGWWLILFSS